jgi:hypothetical protein
MLAKDTRFPSIDALQAFEVAARLGSISGSGNSQVNGELHGANAAT